GPAPVPAPVLARPADRPFRAPASLAAREAPARPVRGAGVGDLRAADRLPARGRYRAPRATRAGTRLGGRRRRVARVARSAPAAGDRGHGARATAVLRPG